MCHAVRRKQVFGRFYYKAKDYFKKPKNVLSIITVALFFVYTSCSAEQYLVVADQEQRELRAYAGVTRVNVSDPQRWPTVILNVYFKNFGSTPASHVKAEMVAFMAQQDPNEIYIPAAQTLQAVNSANVLWPGQEGHISTPVKLRPKDADSLLRGQAVLVLFGKITYSDAFSSRHKSNFCWFMDRTTLQISQCQNHNDLERGD